MPETATAPQRRFGGCSPKNVARIAINSIANSPRIHWARHRFCYDLKGDRKSVCTPDPSPARPSICKRKCRPSPGDHPDDARPGQKNSEPFAVLAAWVRSAGSGRTVQISKDRINSHLRRAGCDGPGRIRSWQRLQGCRGAFRSSRGCLGDQLLAGRGQSPGHPHEPAPPGAVAAARQTGACCTVPPATGKVLVLLHGLCMNDLQCRPATTRERRAMLRR